MPKQAQMSKVGFWEVAVNPTPLLCAPIRNWVKPLVCAELIVVMKNQTYSYVQSFAELSVECSCLSQTDVFRFLTDQ